MFSFFPKEFFFLLLRDLRMEETIYPRRLSIYLLFLQGKINFL